MISVTSYSSGMYALMSGHTASSVQVAVSGTRIDSGQEIYKASDDPGRLAIGSRLDIEKAALAQAAENTKDVIELLNEIDNIYTEVDDRLSQAKELAELAQSSYTSDYERALLHVAWTQLLEEARDFVRDNDYGGNYYIGVDRESTVGPTFTLSPVEEILNTFSDIALVTSLSNVTKVSATDTVGVMADNFSVDQVTSGNGQFTAFTSAATNLTAGDTDGNTDIYLYDSSTGTTERVSLGNGGVEVTGSVSLASVSDDGQLIQFRTRDSLVATDTNSLDDFYIYDRSTSTVSIVTADAGGNPGDTNVSEAAMSGDGQYTAFISDSNVLAGPPTRLRVFLRDNTTGTSTIASLRSNGTEVNGNLDQVALSGDATVVSYRSDANGITKTSAGSNVNNGFNDIFINDGGTVEVVSQSSAGAVADGASTGASLDDDGSAIAFTSSATNLVAGDTNGVTDIFVRDRSTNTTQRVSISTAGVEANGNSYNASISGNGQYVVFTSDASNLVAGDTNGVADIFVRDLSTNTTTRVNLPSNNDIGLELTSGSSTATISDDGRYVTFTTSSDDVMAGESGGVTDVFLIDTQGGFGDGGEGETYELGLTYTNATGSTLTGMSYNNVVHSAGHTLAYNNGGVLANAPSGVAVTADGAEDIDITVPGGANGTSFTVSLDLTYDGNTYTLEFGTATAGSMTDGQRLELLAVDGTPITSVTDNGTGLPLFTAYSTFDLQAGSQITYGEDKEGIRIGSLALEDLSQGLTATDLTTVDDAEIAWKAVDIALSQLRINHGDIRGQLDALTSMTMGGALDIAAISGNAANAAFATNIALEKRTFFFHENQAELLPDILEQYAESGRQVFEDLNDIKVPPLTETALEEDNPLSSKFKGLGNGIDNEESLKGRYGDKELDNGLSSEKSESEFDVIA